MKQQHMDSHDDMDEGRSLRNMKSVALMDKADDFVTQQSKRERPILLNIAIEQGKTVGDLLAAIREMRSINILGTVTLG